MPAELPEPPSYLQGYGADEFFRLREELVRLRLLTPLDLSVFCVYCQSYARWRTAEESIASMAERDQLTKGLLIKTSSGDAAQNPLAAVARRAAADMVRFAGEFGMSPAARARISAGIWHEPPPGSGKFGDLLA